MKHVLTLCLSLCLSLIMVAQDFQGVATYKSIKKLNFQLDSTKVNPEMQHVMEMLKKNSQKTYTLVFNKGISLYKEDEQLAPADMENFVNLGDTQILYKNLKENRYTSQNESLSKFFLVQDELPKHNWKFTNEKKYIGDYECFKATKMIGAPVLKARISANSFEDEDIINNEVEMRQQEVVAWYTTQIPINNGPGMYHGLPGLILEVNDGRTTIICNKIVLNPNKEVNVKEPKRGNKMTQKEYDKIVGNKMKEIGLERNNSRRGNGDVEVRIVR